MAITQAFNRDCMEAMREFPDNFFDLAIVDPPYGIDVNMNIGIRKGKRKKRKQKDWDNSIPDQSYFDELHRVSKGQIIWGGNYFPSLGIYNPRAKRISDFKALNGIVWDKGETMYGRDFSEAEIAYSTVGHGWFKRSPIQNNRFHPTQKPVALYAWLLHKFSTPGMSILDTHLGSGSSRIAAHDMGFDFWGYELDPEYFSAQEKRFAQHISQTTLAL